MDPQARGYADYGMGRYESENPYDLWNDPMGHEQWLEGWLEAKELVEDE